MFMRTLKIRSLFDVRTSYNLYYANRRYIFKKNKKNKLTKVSLVKSLAIYQKLQAQHSKLRPQQQSSLQQW